jgi:alkylation response protein AidB-like acyl-CoA dehydrogenase
MMRLKRLKQFSAAKSRVGKAIYKVGQEAIQIHGGIGMTDELGRGSLVSSGWTALDIQFR